MTINYTNEVRTFTNVRTTEYLKNRKLKSEKLNNRNDAKRNDYE